MLYIVYRYVVEKDIENNVVFVSRNYYSFDKKRHLFRAGSLKLLSGLPPEKISQLQCKVGMNSSHDLSALISVLIFHTVTLFSPSG